MLSVLHDLAVFLGLAAVSSLAAVVITLLIIRIRERLVRRSVPSDWPPESSNLECRKITRVVDNSPTHFSMNRNRLRNPEPAAQPEESSRTTRFVPIQIKVFYRREEWHLTPAERLLPKPNWN